LYVNKEPDFFPLLGNPQANASGCPLQPEADPSFGRIRGHDDGESTNFFCELLKQDTSEHVGVDDCEVAFDGASER